MIAWCHDWRTTFRPLYRRSFIEGLAYFFRGGHKRGSTYCILFIFPNCYCFVFIVVSHSRIFVCSINMLKDADLIDCYVTMFLFQIQKLGSSYKFSIDSDPLTSGRCRFMNGSGRGVTGLVSFPGSGNTWVRELLQTATGICTGTQLYYKLYHCDQRSQKSQ